MKRPDKPTGTPTPNKNDTVTSNPRGEVNRGEKYRAYDKTNNKYNVSTPDTRSENDIPASNHRGQANGNPTNVAFNNTGNNSSISLVFAGRKNSNATSNITDNDNTVATSSNGCEQTVTGDIPDRGIRQVQNPETAFSDWTVPDGYLAVPERFVHHWDSKVFVFDKYSPLSTWYPRSFTVNRQTYISRRQYLEHQRALLHKNQEAADKILHTTDPDEIGIEIKGFNNKRWQRYAGEFLYQAAAHQFSYNSDLKEMLLDTGDLYLGDASVHPLFATGVEFDSMFTLKTMYWNGSNLGGRVLMEIRQNLKRKQVIVPKIYKTRTWETVTSTCDRDTNGDGECVVWKLDTAKHKREKYVLLPEKSIHKQNSQTFIFDAHVSPFSDVYPAPFIVDGQTYSCAKQYIAHQQTLMFGDLEAARKILNTTDPHEMRVKGFGREKWKQHEEKVLIDAKVYKFGQNDKLMDLLLNTGDLHLGCQSSNLNYGTGIMRNRDDSLNRNKWIGENRDGEALMVARDILRSQHKTFVDSKDTVTRFQVQLLDRKQWLNSNNRENAVLGRKNMESEIVQYVPVGTLEDSDAEMRLKDDAEKILNVHKGDLSEKMPPKYILLPESLVHRHDSRALVYKKLSPFSDWYPAQFAVNGQKYTCSLQYAEHQKALLFGDEEKARNVLEATDPEGIELYEVEDSNEEKLKQYEGNILCDAAFHKFSQIPKLKKLLLSTADLSLGFAFPDIRYGTGVHFGNTHTLDRSLWSGENRCGKALMRARYLLKTEAQGDILPEIHTPPDNVTSSNSEFVYQSIDWENLNKWEPGQYIPVPEIYVHRQDTQNFLYDENLSPFSELFPAPFTVDGQTYSYAQQYILHQKALIFRDQDTANEAGFQVEIKGFNNKKGNNFKKIISICASIYKFSQNEKLKELLLNTNSLYFGSMGRNLRCGSGMMIDSDKAFDRETWPGENRNGEVLVASRDLLRMGDKILKIKIVDAMYSLVGDYLASKGRARKGNEKKVTVINHNDVTENLKTNRQRFSEKCLPVCEKLIHKQDFDTLVYYLAYSPFSDNHPAPFIVDEQRFSCATQYIRYHKAMLVGDQETAEKILKLTSPEEIVALKVHGLKMKTWSLHANKIFTDAYYHKFSQNSKLKQLLLRTGNLHLGETHTDTFYGIGIGFDKTEALDRKQWIGENVSGKALMAARDKLRKQEVLLMTQESSRDDNEGASQEGGECEEEMPDGCVPVWEYRIHKQNSETFIFNSRMSPFSCRHPAPFTVKGQTYSCAKQYIAHQQALMFGDLEAARKILNATDPDEMSLIPVKGFRRGKFELREGSIMINAAVHKFSQNEKLKQLLFNTGDLLLGSMGRNRRHATGKVFDAKGTCGLDRKQWPGQNIKGETLMAARNILRKRDNTTLKPGKGTLVDRRKKRRNAGE